MEHDEKEQNEDPFEEPPLADFLPNEEDEWFNRKAEKRRSLVTKAVECYFHLP